MSRGGIAAAAIHLVVFLSASTVAYFGGSTLGLPAGTAWVLFLVALIGLPFAIMLGRNPQGVLASSPEKKKAPVLENRSGAMQETDRKTVKAGPDRPSADPSPWGRMPAGAPSGRTPSKAPSATPEESPLEPRPVLAETPAAPRSATQAPLSPGPAGDPRSLAVVPFTIAGSDPTIQYLADGLAEEVLLGLGRLDGARVPARGSTFRNSGLSPVEAARSLGAAHVLHATISRRANQLTLIGAVDRATDGKRIWNGELTGSLDDLGDLASRLIEAVAGAVGFTIPAETDLIGSGRRTNVAAAQDYYLQGRYQWHLRGDGLRRSAVLFEQALHADPDFALAHAGKADANMLLGFYGYMEPKSAFQNAIAAAETALALDDAMPEAWTAVAFVKSFFDWDWSRSEVSFKRAVDLNPTYVTARFWYAMSLGVRGRPSDWVRQNVTALKSDPASVYANAHLGWALLVGARAFSEAEARFQTALERDPGFSLGYWFRGRAKLHQGDVRSALADLTEGAKRSRGNPLTLGTLGYALAQNGDRAAAERHLQDLRAGPTGWRWVRASQIGTILLGLGRETEALEALERATTERDFWLPLTVARPEWDSVRADPRFVAIMTELGVQDVSAEERQAAVDALSD